MRSENFQEIMISSISKLLLGSGDEPVWVMEMGDDIFPASLYDRMGEETGISIPSNRPVLFESLSVVGIILGKNGFVPKGQVFLDSGVLKVRRPHLKMKDLILNSFKLIRNLRLCFAPPVQVLGEVMGF